MSNISYKILWKNIHKDTYHKREFCSLDNRGIFVYKFCKRQIIAWNFRT